MSSFYAMTLVIGKDKIKIVNIMIKKYKLLAVLDILFILYLLKCIKK